MNTDHLINFVCLHGLHAVTQQNDVDKLNGEKTNQLTIMKKRTSMETLTMPCINYHISQVITFSVFFFFVLLCLDTNC